MPKIPGLGRLWEGLKYPGGALKAQFKAAPLRTSGYALMNLGGAGLTYNQLANAFSDERRERLQRVKSEEMNKVMTDLFLPPERKAKLQKTFKEFPTKVTGQLGKGFQEGSALAAQQLGKDIQERPGHYGKALGTAVAVGSVPLLAYLVWRNYAKDDDEKQQKTAGLRSWWKARRARAAAKPKPPAPEDLPGGKIFGTMATVTGLGSVGAGLYGAGKNISDTMEKGQSLAEALQTDPDRPGKFLRAVTEKAESEVGKHLSPKAVAQSVLTSIESAAKSPWTYALAGGAIGLPWLLGRLLYKRKKEREEGKSPKTAGVDEGPSALQTAGDWTAIGSAATLLPLLFTRGGRRVAGRAYPVAGTAIGLASLYDPEMATRMTSRLGGRALQATEKAFKEKQELEGKRKPAGPFELVAQETIDRTAGQATSIPSQLHNEAKATTAGFGKSLTAPANRPVLTGSLIGAGVGLTGLLGYLLYRRFRDRMERADKPDVQRMLGPIGFD